MCNCKKLLKRITREKNKKRQRIHEKIFSKILVHIGNRGRGLLFETNCLSFSL